MRKLMFAVVLLPLIVMGARRVTAQDGVGSFQPDECMFEGFDLGVTNLTGNLLGFECGYVVVPLRHADPDGATIRIPVAIHRALSTSPSPDPLLVAQGGPGGDAFGIYSLLTPASSIASERDIVIFNQRGTAYAEPDLDCPEADEVLPEMLAAANNEADDVYDQAIVRCFERLVAEGVDLSAFNSLENAADIPMIARALGYDEFNFYGVSYATLLGLHLLRNHPEGLRSVILDSVVPTDINFISEIPTSETRVLNEVFAACDADPECRENYPDLEERYFALVRRFNESPFTVMLTEPKTGVRHEAYVDGDSLRSILFQLLYLPHMSAVFPKIISDLEKGDTHYLESMWPLLVFDQLISEGMYYSVICAEDADIDLDKISVDGLPPEIAQTAREEVESVVKVCAEWKVDRLPSSVDDPVQSDIPTLLLSGRFDPVTPPSFAQAAAAGLTNSTLLVDPVASHGVAFLSGCVDGIISGFLDDPAATIDTSCLVEQKNDRIVPPNAITLPLIAKINQLDAGIIVTFGLAVLLLLILLSPFLIWPLVFVIRAFQGGQPAREPQARRRRILSRVLLLTFGVLALAFFAGLSTAIIRVLSTDLAMATAMALPGSTAPILWIPVVLLVLAIGIFISAVMLWRTPGAGSTAGNIYYTFLGITAVALLIVLGWQHLLLPPI